MADDPEYRIARLSLEPGDILVVKLAEDMSRPDLAAWAAQFKSLVPNNRLLLVSGDIELSVLTQADISKRTI